MTIGENLPPKAGPMFEANAVAIVGVALNRIEEKLDSALKLLESLIFAGNLKGEPAPRPAPSPQVAAGKTSWYYKGGDGSYHNVNIQPDNPICPLCAAMIKAGRGKYGSYYYCTYDKVYFNESKKRGV